MVNDDRVTELVECCLYEQSPLSRDSARSELLKYGKQFPCKALLGMLETATRPIQRRVVRLLGDVPPGQLRVFVEEAFRQPETSPRTLVALARLLTSQSEQDEPLLSLGLKHVDARVRKACATKGASSTSLWQSLFDSDELVRDKAALVLLTRELNLSELAADGLADAERLMNQLTDVDTNCWVLLFKLFPKHPTILSRTKNELRQIDFLEDVDGIRENRSASLVEKAWALSRLGSVSTDAASHEDSRVRQAFVRSGQATQAQLTTLKLDSCPGVRWLSAQALAGRYLPDKLVERTAPHERLNAASAKPPYGIRPGDERVSAQRVQAALALCHNRLDVNLGVAVRSAEAAGFQEVFVVGHTPLFRTAMRGADFVIPVIQVPDGESLIRESRNRGYQLVAVQQTPVSVPFHEAEYPPQPLFMMGAEDIGLPNILRRQADLAIDIPMFGEIDSLNVAAAATTVIFHWRLCCA